MPQTDQLQVPHAPLPSFLQGLALPATLDDAIDYAEEHGAPEEVIRFMESLPAAVFTSDEGLRHAFSLYQPGSAAIEPGEVAIAHDGISS
jgi:hypothetical protein